MIPIEGRYHADECRPSLEKILGTTTKAPSSPRLGRLAVICGAYAGPRKEQCAAATNGAVTATTLLKMSEIKRCFSSNTTKLQAERCAAMSL